MKNAPAMILPCHTTPRSLRLPGVWRGEKGTYFVSLASLDKLMLNHS
jgi:hypothetical protein